MMCMKLEYLADGSPECPLIRLYEFTRDEARALRYIFCSLANGAIKTVSLEREPFIVPVSECQLILAADGKDRGIRASGSKSFECDLTELAWDNVAGLTEPFCHFETTGYQWLTSTGRVRLLISCDGKW